MIDALEAGQQHLALVHRRIEAQVPIDVGVDDEVGRLRDDDLVVDDRDAERRDQRRFLHERMRAVGLAVAVGVLQHDDAIAFGLPGMMGAVANAFGHPDAPVPVDVDVGRVAQQRRCGPQRDFEPLRHLEEVERNLYRRGGLLSGAVAPDPPASKAARTPAGARRPPAPARASRQRGHGQSRHMFPLIVERFVRRPGRPVRADAPEAAHPDLQLYTDDRLPARSRGAG